MLPLFWLGFPLLVIAYVTPLTTYIIYRNQHVALSQRVLTRPHLRYWFSVNLGRLGVKIEAEKKAAWQLGPPVKLEGAGRGERDNRVNTLAARQSLGFNEARRVMAETLGRRATAAMLEFGQQQVDVRYMIDGVWHNDEPQTREVCDPMLESLKLLCGLNPQERQARQKGAFTANYDSIDYAAAVTAQGTATGERIVIQFESEKVQFKTLDDLGMRPKMQEQLLGLLAQRQGFVLLSAMPASGLRSTTNVVLQKTDRFTREFLAMEDEAHPYEGVENIPVTTYKSGPNVPEDAQLMHVLVKLFRMEPEVFVMRDLVDGEAINFTCEKILENRLIVGTVRAKDCAEAILRVLALKVSAKAFARSLTGVLNQRLIRKLCDGCKEAYAPTPQILQQLGIPPGRVQAFFRPPQEPEKVCEKCGGIGYHGRTAVFELMMIDDTVRKLVATGGKMDDIRQAARKAGMQNLQAEGIVLVAKGVTSLPELMRVMKQ
jgi:type II secretory ATPase GspE/PulE/Tfp pilus assembly ATPase PilB-like protein